MILGVRKEVAVRETEGEEEIEGVIVGRIRGDKKIIRVVGVYVNGDMERKLDKLENWMVQKEEGIGTIIGGDFNARTGEEGGKESIEGTDGWEFRRRSRDKKLNKEGRRLTQFIKERGWFILNGGIRGDNEGNWTYTGGRGESVIDYVMVEEDIEEEIERMEVVNRIESDHHPVVVWLKGDRRGRKGGRRERGREVRGVWDEEGREDFKNKLGEIGIGERRVDEEIEEAEEKIRDALKKVEKERGAGGRERKGWWDEECRSMKRETRRVLKRWWKGVEEKRNYREKRKEYMRLCEQKKEEENKRVEKEAEEARTEEQ
ncbi:PREDICTED: golgin subfamily A member 6-like protein 1, partial [Vollenhovia emeryi]|uniref:golgin subfamily A member 6-like protein 1 n=1 Tax=Vollenhovia emeryi TaxID=411798 RepID=UPI0005F3635E